jgi:hypothetical protein
MKATSSDTKEIERIAQQLGLDITLLRKEILWSLGEVRINQVTPTYQQFREWNRRNDGPRKFWAFADSKLDAEVTQDEILDIWNCIDLTLNARKRRAFTFQEYLMIAVRSDQKCEICGKRPPEVSLEIDHILPVSKGGTELVFNLRFLCQYHWADIWRRL